MIQAQHVICLSKRLLKTLSYVDAWIRLNNYSLYIYVTYRSDADERIPELGARVDNELVVLAGIYSRPTINNSLPYAISWDLLQDASDGEVGSLIH